eukprot:jgi/Undpi1/8164/HiC_scaffold_24.g10634.m1
MTSTHKMSYSNHEIYHEALRWTKFFVNIGLVYGALLLVGAIDVLGPYWVLLLGLRQGALGGDWVGGGEWGGITAADMGRRRSGALGLATAGVMGLLVAVMVRRCCRFDRSRDCVVANWHDLFKYTHMGRAITAAMSAVLAWRGLWSLHESNPPGGGGGGGRYPVVIIAASGLSMLAAGSMHFLHYRVKSVYMEYSRLRRDSLKRA